MQHTPPLKSVFLFVITCCAWLLAQPTNADVLWDMRATPAIVPAGQHIRIGTLSGPWEVVLDYFKRPALCDNGWYLEYRTAPTAENGWSAPIVGVDDAGICAAVRTPATPPAPIDDDPTTLAGAFASLGARIDTERRARITAAVGAQEEQMARLARAQTLQARIAAGAATDQDRAELALLLEQAEYVEQVRLYAVTPASPPMWINPLPPMQTLYGWAEASLGSVAEVDAIDPASPPTTAPQWPEAD